MTSPSAKEGLSSFESKMVSSSRRLNCSKLEKHWHLRPGQVTPPALDLATPLGEDNFSSTDRSMTLNWTIWTDSRLDLGCHLITLAHFSAPRHPESRGHLWAVVRHRVAKATESL